MRSANRLRAWLIAVLVLAAVVSVVGNKTQSPLISWLSFALFLVAVSLYLSWRKAVRDFRRGRVLDREAQTSDETRTGPDQ